MVSKATIEFLHKRSTTLRCMHECVCVRACDRISETKAFLSPKTAEFLQLEGKSVSNTTDGKILVCLSVCASTQKCVGVCTSLQLFMHCGQRLSTHTT